MKKGNVSVANIFIALILILFIIYITCYLVSILQVFILYQKLDNIVSKYIFIIQNYGDLKEDEKQELYDDLQKGGFNLDKVSINEPKSKNYGELAEFAIYYEFDINEYYLLSSIKNYRTINICLKKNFYIIN